MEKILCAVGFHFFEKESSKMELIKETVRHILFCSEGVQKGIKKCLRPGCNKTVKVWRIGWVGAGGKGGRWRGLSERIENYIDSLPTM